MLRLGLALVGTAMLLHSRKVRATDDEKQGADQDPDSSPGNPNTQYPPTPVLDPSITTNPLLTAPPGAYGDLGWNNSLGTNLGLVPGYGFGGVPQLLPQGLGSGQTIGAITPNQLSAANHMYQNIVGAIPGAIAQKIANVKSLADFQSRVIQQNVSLAKKAISWHKRIFHF